MEDEADDDEAVDDDSDNGTVASRIFICPRRRARARWSIRMNPKTVESNPARDLAL